MQDFNSSTIENVLLVSIDCLREDWLQRGISEGIVPTLERLTTDGLYFDQAFTVANTTDPSLTSFMTASYPHTHGVQENGWGLDESVPVLAESIQDEGHETFGVVSVDHLSDEHSGLGRGFDEYCDGGGSYDTLYPILSRIYDTQTFNTVFGAVKDIGTEQWNLKSLLRQTGLIRLHCRTAKSVTQDAVDQLDRVDGPFFGWVHYFDMHEPRNYDRSDLESHDEYTAAMKLVDGYVQQLLDELEERNRRDETLVILTADHGEALDDHGYTGHGRQLYDEELHVPLAFHHPDIEPETVSDQVRTIDIAPTVLDLLDVDVPEAFEGRSIRANDDGTPPGDRDTFLTAYPEFAESIGLRTPGWKLIREGSDHELYDLSADPDEENDLVAAGATDGTPYDDLREKLQAWDSAGSEVSDQDVDADTQEMLKDLGYVD